MRTRLIPVLFLLPLAAISTKSAAAQAFVVDFDGFDLAGALSLDTAETLVFSNVGGSGVTVTINGGGDIRIYDLLLFGGDPNTTGQALLDWAYSTPSGTDIEFDPPIENFSMLAGDFGGDDDSPLRIVAYDINGTELAEDSRPWPETQFPPFARLSVNASGIKRVHYLSSGQFMNSTFIDDLSFTFAVLPVQPTTWGRIKSLYR